ncbi:hypothetical protein OROMI_019134 [Orobanche minor]
MVAPSQAQMNRIEEIFSAQRQVQEQLASMDIQREKMIETLNTHYNNFSQKWLKNRKLDLLS